MTKYRYSYALGCTIIDDFMTVRTCIEKMRKYGTSKITLNNGTKIVIHEINVHKYDEPFSRIKWNHDGSVRVIRRIFCSIYPSPKTKMLDELKEHRNNEGRNGRGYRDYWMWDPDDRGYQYFREEDYILPEKVMNQFIKANEGIDEYTTIQEPAYMYDDMMSLCQMADELMD